MLFHWYKVVCVEICLGNLHKNGCNFTKVSGQPGSSVTDSPSGRRSFVGLWRKLVRNGSEVMETFWSCSSLQTNRKWTLPVYNQKVDFKRSFSMGNIFGAIFSLIYYIKSLLPPNSVRRAEFSEGGTVVSWKSYGTMTQETWLPGAQCH